jgi:benzil reductase ((S)-benzoin forming)
MIVITGTSQGLGGSLFDKISCRGMELIAISRRFLHKQIEKAKLCKFIKLIELDFSVPESIEPKLSGVVSNLNEVIFINNAATVGEIKIVSKLDPQNIINSINVNFVSPVILINFFCRIAKFVTIINVTSGAAIRPIDSMSLYCSTKCAIKSFLDVVAIQSNVAVINIDPGIMDTHMQGTIRSARFNGVDTFINFKKDGLLKNANDVAEEIFDSYIKDRITS